MKKLLFASLAVALTLSSCKKDENAGTVTPSAISSTSDLKVPANFDWRANHTVTLDISQLAASDEAQAIKIKDSKGNLLVSRVMKIQNDSKLYFQLSKAEREIELIHNGVSEDIPVSQGRAQMPMIKKGGKGNKGGGGSGSTGCDCEGRMRNFTVVYSGNSTTTFHLREKASKQTYPLVYSIPNVNPGDTVTFNGYDKHGRLKSQSFVEINGVVYNIHTSCSIDILGMVFGPITVIAYTDGNGAYCGPTGPPPCVDSDNDGCCDKDDAFPNDPTRCDIQYVPGENVYGSYAWEDLWPSTGDFDFNDKVIDRNTALIVDQNGEVIEAIHKFVLRAAGASFTNGFGFAMPGITPAEVANVSNSYNQPQNYTSISANGTEAGQSEAVVIVYENWKDIVTYTKNGAFFNTVKNNPNITAGEGYADTITITVQFAVPQNIVDVLEIDPFLIKNSTRGAEVHLPWYGPTDLANHALFGTASDASAYPNTGNNYVTANNIPWAIETPLSAFDWPLEKVDIVTVYYDFAQWAQTGSPANWYSNGNRDATKIY